MSIPAVVTALLFMLGALLGSWIGGFDFNERGGRAMFIYVMTLIAGGLGYIFGGGR